MCRLISAHTIATSCSPALRRRSAKLQSLRQDKCFLPVGPFQEAVAAAQSEPIGLPDRGACANLDGEIELSTHFTDEELLLIVLAAEIGRIWLHNIQQFEHDSGDAAEMSRSEGSFENPREGLDLHERGKTGRIKAFHLRSKHEVDAGLVGTPPDRSRRAEGSA